MRLEQGPSSESLVPTLPYDEEMTPTLPHEDSQEGPSSESLVPTLPYDEEMAPTLPHEDSQGGPSSESPERTSPCDEMTERLPHEDSQEGPSSESLVPTLPYDEEMTQTLPHEDSQEGPSSKSPERTSPYIGRTPTLLVKDPEQRLPHEINHQDPYEEASSDLASVAPAERQESTRELIRQHSDDEGTDSDSMVAKLKAMIKGQFDEIIRRLEANEDMIKRHHDQIVRLLEAQASLPSRITTLEQDDLRPQTPESNGAKLKHCPTLGRPGGAHHDVEREARRDTHFEFGPVSIPFKALGHSDDEDQDKEQDEIPSKEVRLKEVRLMKGGQKTFPESTSSPKSGSSAGRQEPSLRIRAREIGCKDQELRRMQLILELEGLEEAELEAQCRVKAPCGGRLSPGARIRGWTPLERVWLKRGRPDDSLKISLPSEQFMVTSPSTIHRRKMLPLEAQSLDMELRGAVTKTSRPAAKRKLEH
jgi:hypothetical protein